MTATTGMLKAATRSASTGTPPDFSGRRGRRAAARGKLGDARNLLLAPGRLDDQRQVCERQGRAQLFGRTGMHLVRELEPFWMIRRQHHGEDRSRFVAACGRHWLTVMTFLL
jgi:hypothetical protein